MVDENPRTELTEDQIRVLRALAKAATEVDTDDPTSVDIFDGIIADYLGMTVEEVQAHTQVLTDLGYVVRREVIDYGEEDTEAVTQTIDQEPPPELTDDQKRVLRALAEAAREVNPDDPTGAGILDQIIADRLGMTVEEVQAHTAVLEDVGFLVRAEIIDDDEDEDGLTFDERRVYKAYMMALETNRPHRTNSDMAAQLGMSVAEIEVIADKLTEAGLLNSAWDRLTKDQQRVLMATPAWGPDMERSPTTAELAEQLGMDIEYVRECIRVLKEGRWLWDIEPRTVLDALMSWGWHTPADELAQRLHMDIAEVDQRLLELAEIGYDVRLV